LKEAKETAQSEIVDLQDEKADAQKDAEDARARMNELAPKLKSVEKLAAQFSADPEELLPEAGALETAKIYREKKAKPLLDQYCQGTAFNLSFLS
jgi:predicted  nucleic acid-binding Zn-ribbon protein